MKTSTKSSVVDETTLSSETKPNDCGRALLIEAFDEIHANRQVGELYVQFGQGGSISLIRFRETTTISQADRKELAGSE